MSRPILFALVSGVGISLRPSLPDSESAIGDQVVAAAVANLSALSLQSRSSASDSLAVLGAASDILSKIDSSEPPPSLSADTIAALNEVITLIQETVYREMDAGHQADVEALAAAAAAVSACNSALHTSTGAGAIHQAEQRAIELQNDYEDAHGDAVAKEEEKTRQQNAFDAHMGSIQQLTTCTLYPNDRSEDRWDEYFNLPPDLATFEQQKAAYEEKKNAYHQAIADLEDSNQGHAAAQGALADSFCNMLVLMQTGCNDLDVCHATAMEQFEEVKARAEENMQLRKDAYAAGEGATEHLRQLLGLDAPENPVERSYELDIPVPESKASCSVATMEGQQTWEDFLQISSCDLPAGDSSSAPAMVSFNLAESGCTEDAGVVSCNPGQFVTSNQTFSRPLAITLDMKSFPQSECVSFTVFAPGEKKNDEISYQIGGWATQWRLFPGDVRGEMGLANLDWRHLGMVLDETDGVEFWLDGEKIHQTTSSLSSGHIRFFAGCTGMRVQNIQIQATSRAEPSST